MRNIKGFTFVEVLTVTVIIGILATIAIPLFFAWVPNMRLKADTRELHTAFMKAKAEAAKRNSMVAITFNQPVGGTPSAYVVYVDTNNNFQFDAGEVAITNVQQWSNDVSLVPQPSPPNFTLNGAGNPTIAFRPTTIPIDFAGIPASGTASLLSSTGRTLNVVVSPAGNVTTN